MPFASADPIYCLHVAQNQLCLRSHWPSVDVEPCGAAADTAKGLSQWLANAENDEIAIAIVNGSPGTGKTVVIDWCLKKLKEESEVQPVIARLNSSEVGSDTGAMKALCQRLHAAAAGSNDRDGNFSKRMKEVDSFEEHEMFMAELLEFYANRKQRVVVVMDDIHTMIDPTSRQVFLYSLIDCVHDKNLAFSIIATTYKTNLRTVMEKRVRSRMNMS